MDAIGDFIREWGFVLAALGVVAWIAGKVMDTPKTYDDEPCDRNDE